jgi:hypothetical protein
MTTLPANFFLYISTRKSSYDLYSGLVLMKTTADGSTSVIDPLPDTPVKYIVDEVAAPSDGSVSYGTFAVKGSTIEVVKKRVRDWRQRFVIRNEAGLSFPVLEISGVQKLFAGVVYLKRNVLLVPIPPSSVSASAPSVSAPVTYAPVLPAFTSAVAAAIKRPTRPVVQQLSLNPFVAKQLLALAQHRKEMCPITAEDFIDGETAVMPCGHLFMRMAIDETFKKEKNRCPSCRQVGVPTMV